MANPQINPQFQVINSNYTTREYGDGRLNFDILVESINQAFNDLSVGGGGITGASQDASIVILRATDVTLDASIVELRNAVPTGVLKEASIGDDFSWDSSGNLQIDTVQSLDYFYTKTQVDSSFYFKAQVDASFALKTELPSGAQDTSIADLYSVKVSADVGTEAGESGYVSNTGSEVKLEYTASGEGYPYVKLNGAYGEENVLLGRRYDDGMGGAYTAQLATNGNKFELTAPLAYSDAVNLSSADGSTLISKDYLNNSGTVKIAALTLEGLTDASGTNGNMFVVDSSLYVKLSDLWRTVALTTLYINPMPATNVLDNSGPPGSVDIIWDDNNNSGKTIFYEVWRNDGDNVSTTGLVHLQDASAEVSTKSYSDTTYVPGASYYYRVWTYDNSVSLYSLTYGGVAATNPM